MQRAQCTGIADGSDTLAPVNGAPYIEKQHKCNQVSFMLNKTIYALGFFDGVHLGHQALLRACRDLADRYHCCAGVVTFTTHPDALVFGKAPALLNTSEDRKRLLRTYGTDTVKELAFDQTLMATHWQDFLSNLSDAAGFVCGSDFRFGAKGEGTADKLSAYCAERGIPCAIVPQQVLNGIRVSSTHIRSLLEAGETEEAVCFLGHPHTLTGQVVPGRALGRTLGIPTANIPLPAGVICPKHGVYACKAHVRGIIYPAVTNIGSRPTVGGHHVTIEPWILDFDGDLYGQEITLDFYRFLRPEQKFDSLEELKAEIQKNAAQTRKILEKT